MCCLLIFRAQMLCDLKIKIGSKIFFVHKIVLASSSEYFNMMFTENFIESKKDEITMDELLPDIFEILIDYMYTLNIKITENNVLVIFYYIFFPIIIYFYNNHSCIHCSVLLWVALETRVI